MTFYLFSLPCLSGIRTFFFFPYVFIFLLSIAYKLNVSPWSMYAEALIPSVMVFGGAALGKWTGCEGGALVNGISSLMRRHRREMSLSWQCKDTAGRQPFANKEEGSCQTPSLWHLDLGFPASRTKRNKSFRTPSLWHFVRTAWAD